MLLTRSAIQSQYRQCWITELGRVVIHQLILRALCILLGDRSLRFVLLPSPSASTINLPAAHSTAHQSTISLFGSATIPAVRRTGLHASALDTFREAFFRYPSMSASDVKGLILVFR